MRLDKPLNADVPRDVVAQTVGLQPQQARDAAVSVAERVDAEKVEVRRGEANERMYPTLRHAAVPEGHHFRNRRSHLVGVYGLESDAATVLRNLDNLRLTRTVLARIA